MDHNVVPAWKHIAAGRAALAARHRCGERFTAHAEESVTRLLALLWHADAEIRRAAALALAAGDGARSYKPDYGHFAGAFLRGLEERAPAAPPDSEARYGAVVETLCALLEQHIHEISGMSNMRYSFLSSALYLALLSTCRDTIEAIRRLRAVAAQGGLCRLMWSLSRRENTRKLNPADMNMLARTAGQALAALPADRLTDLWQRLSHHAPAHRIAMVPALEQLRDRSAVPHLLDLLPEQPPSVAEPILACFGRLHDPRALPALHAAAGSGHRSIRRQANAAIAAIARAHSESASRTLLRPTPEASEPESLLRPVAGRHDDGSPEELLRVHAVPESAEGDVS